MPTHGSNPMCENLCRFEKARSKKRWTSTFFPVYFRCLLSGASVYTDAGESYALCLLNIFKAHPSHGECDEKSSVETKAYSSPIFLQRTME